MHKILVVEDDIDLSELIKLHLEQAGYKVIEAHNGLEAIALVQLNADVDLILLDIMLPDIEGTNVCVSIRKTVFCPIIFMSAIDDQEYILKAFDNGGDDYIIKPIKYEQLLARVDAAIRRSKNYSKKVRSAESYTFGAFTLKFNERLLYKNDDIVFLPPTQLNLLMYLIENKDQLVTYEMIFKEIWHQQHIGDVRSLAVHISNLRNALENYECIVSVRGEGYRFDTSKI